jgi:3-phosphoshikimate 1-carboxyvinyltransferase
MNNKIDFGKIKEFDGKLKLTGDKSISHRAVFFASMAEGESIIENISLSADVESTMNCFKALGVDILKKDDKVFIKGAGFDGFKEPNKPLDAGNSGTTSRLLIGLLAARNIKAEIIGDESLSKRPMNRIISPLNNLGASITSNNGYLPVKINGNGVVKKFNYELPVASAQLKTSLILYGLHSDEESTIIEKIPSRNHTEIMLNLHTIKEGNLTKINFSKKNYPIAQKYFVPGDISSAAFFIIMTILNKNSSLLIENVSLNPTRTGFLNVLKKMGADIEIVEQKSAASEIYGNLLVKSSKLTNIEIPIEIIPNIIDEIPILAIAGLFGEGKMIVKGAEELRIKECDRIKAIVENIKKLNVEIDEMHDGFVLLGKPEGNFAKVLFESYDDHRIAMAFAVLSMVNENGGSVSNFDCVRISNPIFLKQVQEIIS